MKWSLRKGQFSLKLDNNTFVYRITGWRNNEALLRAHQRNLLTQSITIKYILYMLRLARDGKNTELRQSTTKWPMILSSKGRKYCMIYIN